MTTAVARGDLSQKITVDAKGEIAELKGTIKRGRPRSGDRSPTTVTRVAREVGTEGRLGVEAEVEDAAQFLADLTDNVNTLIRGER